MENVPLLPDLYLLAPATDFCLPVCDNDLTQSCSFQFDQGQIAPVRFLAAALFSNS